MKLTSAGYEHIGKVFLAVGQGIILASLIAMLLTEKTFSFPNGVAGAALDLGAIYIGIWYIEISAKLKKKE